MNSVEAPRASVMPRPIMEAIPRDSFGDLNSK